MTKQPIELSFDNSYYVRLVTKKLKQANNISKVCDEVIEWYCNWLPGLNCILYEVCNVLMISYISYYYKFWRFLQL